MWHFQVPSNSSVLADVLFFFGLDHILILLIVLCPLKCWELLQDGGAQSFDSSFCACCDVAGLRVGVVPDQPSVVAVKSLSRAVVGG